MTEEIAPRFLPWLRSGLAAQITTPAVDGLAVEASTTAAVAIRLRSTGSQPQLLEDIDGPGVRLRGPGEVIGIDPAEVIRHDPEPGSTDAEPNYFTGVELASPDLPWRFTPATPDDDQRLQPWIALVVVEERDGVWLEDRGPLLRPVLHVDDASAELPDSTQVWAWAHVQADHDLAAGVAAALAEQPTAFKARLVCPRRLIADRAWLACIVPTFEAGRLAGLGLSAEPGAVAGVAWSDSGPVQLPVYHHWRFHTGPTGDFESLVRRLTPRELPGSVGRRDLDIGTPGGGLPRAPGTLVSFEGALVSPAGRSLPWPAAHRTAMKDALRRSLNAALAAPAQSDPATYDALTDDPVVGPPAYAATQAGRRRVPATGQPPVWFEQLNTEPHRRAAAGLGAEVVRHDQSAFMAAAWAFAAKQREVNRTLGRARLAWELAGPARAQFISLPDEALVQVAGPALGRLPHSSGTTILGSADAAALPSGLVSGTFRRLCGTVRGFALTSAAGVGRVVPTDAVTGTALVDPVGFVGGWATARVPVGAEVTESPGAASAAAEAAPVARIVPKDPDDPSTPVPVGDSLARQIRSGLDPAGVIVAMVESRIVGLPVERDHVVPARIWVRPRFTTPMYQRLRALSVDYLVPGLSDIPPDTVGLLEVNPGFVEAFHAGLNHELGREFVWREFPARPSATWAQHFWDPQVADIAVIARWDPATGLGTHRPDPSTAADLVLLIRGALPRRYPDLRVYAVEAEWQDGARRERPDGQVAMPVFTGALGRDATFYGFQLGVEEARGSTRPADQDPGYFFVIEQRPTAPRFGLDVAQSRFRGTAPQSWPNLSWAHLVGPDVPLPTFADTAGPEWLVDAGALTGNGGPDRWGANAAAMARITWQRPIRMLTHADSMLPEPGGAP